MRLNEVVRDLQGRRKGVRSDTVANLYDYWQGTKHGALRLRLSGSGTNVESKVESSRRVKFKQVRVGVTFQFENPETDEIQTIGMDFDIPTGMTKEELLHHISNKIFEWLFAYYNFRDLSQFKTEDFMNQIVIRTLEGI
jgi:hypothetical protein